MGYTKRLPPKENLPSVSKSKDSDKFLFIQEHKTVNLFKYSRKNPPLNTTQLSLIPIVFHVSLYTFKLPTKSFLLNSLKNTHYKTDTPCNCLGFKL